MRMKGNVFGEYYSNMYYLLYETKDYEGECDFLEEIVSLLNPKLRGWINYSGKFKRRIL